MVLLDRGEDEVLAAIDNGSLAWAWDISAPGVSRREIRVWRDSLLGMLNSETAKEMAEREVMSFIPSRPIRSSEMCRIFSCSSSHVNGLIDAGLFSVVRQPTQARGVNAATAVSHDSVARFLATRRIQ